MEFDNGFTVDAPVAEVWDAMLDIERVAPCLPGAQVLERTSDDTYKVSIKVRLGPVSMTYRGEVEIAEADADARTAVLRARAKEARGQGTADATAQLRLSDDAGRTRGEMHTDVAISGRAAAMGQGVIADVSAKLIDTFAANLAAMLAGPAPVAEATDVASAVMAATPEPAAATVGAATVAAVEPEPSLAAAPEAPPAPAGAVTPTRAPGGDVEALPVASVLGSVAAARLRDPRTLATAIALAVALGVLAGRRIGRR
jgi:carbon monoxide dehydrogenase subunit G